MSIKNQMKFCIFIILFIQTIFIIGCGENKADLGEADNLIQSGEYDGALTLLKQELRKEYSDSTQYDRIRHRIFLAHKGKLFQTLVSLKQKKDWTGMEAELKKISLKLRSMPEDSSNNYYFDFYYLKASSDSALYDTETWAKSLRRALNFPHAKSQQEKDIFGKLALHYAQKAEFTKALDFMDKMMSKMVPTQMNDQLKKIFYTYQEGKFETVGSMLSKVPDQSKDVHWKRLEFFINSYHNKLKQEDRFKLW